MDEKFWREYYLEHVNPDGNFKSPEYLRYVSLEKPEREITIDNVKISDEELGIRSE